jgi:LacI family transcriptional regulator
MRRTTIKDIAMDCGVSLSTVSLVLNNNPRISEQTRQKVLDSVRKHGYQPNNQARGLASKSSHAVSVVVPHLNHVFADVYFGEIVSGIYDRAASSHYKMVLDVANLKFIRSYEFLNILKSRRADGMLFIASTLLDQYLRALENEPYPFILVNHYFPGSRLNFIAADYLKSADLAVQHLLELGHRKIIRIIGTHVQTAIDFQDRFVEGCRQSGIPESDLPWADGGFSEQEAYKATRYLLNEHPDATAIMAGNDKMAIGAMQSARERGLRIPEDISIMGMDNIPASSFTVPRLTTVHHPLYDIGRLAGEKLLALFQGDIAQCREVLPVHLEVRESTGPARV